jgi:hypothetical protein
MAKQQSTQASASKDEKPAPIATTYYATREGQMWRITRVQVFPGPRFESATHFKHPDMLVVSERLRVLLEQVLP